MNEKQTSSPGGLFNQSPGDKKPEQPKPQEKKVEEPKKENEMAKKAQPEEVKTNVPEPKKQEAPKPAAPKPAETKPAKKLSRVEMEDLRLKKIKSMTLMQLVTEAPKDRFISALVGQDAGKSKLMEAERTFMKEANFAMQLFNENDYLVGLAKNDPVAVIDAIINVAQTGLTLNPVLKLGYLVPMDKKVRFWASYMGKREIVMRTGLVKDAYAKLVYEGEEFDIKYGSGAYLKHTPDPWTKKEQAKIKGGYWVCILKDGTKKFGTMNHDEILAIAKRSPSANAGHSPWKTDWEQMALKTIFNRGFKEMPKSGISDDQLKALEVSDRLEEDDLKQWVRTQKTKQDSFDDDFDEDGAGGVEDVSHEEVK